MRLMREFLALSLAALLAVPAPALAQTIRVVLDAPVAVAPGLSAPVPFALAAPALSAPSLAPPAASFPVLPAPAIQAAPVAIAPVALQPRAAGLIAAIQPAPSAPGRPAEEQKADADKIFDGSAAEPYGEEASLPHAVGKGPADLDRKIAALGRTAAPRPWLEKGKVLLAYGGLTAAAVGMNAPFDRIGPLVVASIMAPMLSAMGLFFYGASQSAVTGAPLEGEAAKPSGETMAMISRLAAEAKVPAPARVKILPGTEIQAQVGARDDAGYEIRFTKAFESLRPEVQEGILRHEFAHERHHDMPWQVVKIFLAPLAPMIALMGADGKTPFEGVLIAAIAAAAILLFPASLKRSEYLADQYAASKTEGAGPLARFFIEDSEDSARAASALSGRPFSSESGLRRRAITAWDSLKRTFLAHPSHDRRIARLARLAAKEAKR
ncbi:MAG: M48 family metalloprotease [Elusimicrobia bacterium]|nr:M48 family metalloprotease [Elusimicrobiota bacterium]